MFPTTADADAQTWLTTSWWSLFLVAVSAVLMLSAIVIVIRIIGLRSLSKMSSFDFAVTVAIGSLLATTVVSSSSLPAGIVAVAVLLAFQWVIAQFRRRTFGSRVVDNRPVLLVRDGRFLDDALDHARVTRSDVYTKLRQANVHRMDEVIAVVLETTGDVSVLHGEGQLDPELYDNIRRFDPQGPLSIDGEEPAADGEAPAGDGTDPNR